MVKKKKINQVVEKYHRCDDKAVKASAPAVSRGVLQDEGS